MAENAGTDAPRWWIGPSGPLVVRNVSQATLTPFLPEPAKATGAAVIVAPGGGTLVLGMQLQGYEIAKWLNEKGIAAFVLKYRLVPTPKDTDAFLELMERRAPKYSDIISPEQSSVEEIATREDGLKAMRYVREHARQWKLSPDKIGFMGFSAGAYTAVGVALKADDTSRPNLLATIYGSMSGPLVVTASAPPLFIAASSDDPLYALGASPEGYLGTYSAWWKAGVPAELHLFSTGGHGFGVAPQGKSSDEWITLFGRWLRERGFYQ